MAFFKHASESSLEGFEDHLHLLVESSPEGMIICDIHERIVFANGEFCRMFGWERQEVIGKFANDIVANSPDIIEEASRISCTVLSTPHVMPDTFRTRRDGTKIPVSLLAGPITNGDSTVGVYGIYRDISSIKQAEAQLRREKAFFENLFENAPEAIVLCDREECVIKANRAFVDLFGFTLEEMGGRDLNLFVAQDPELFREAKNIDAIAWSGGEPFSVDTWRTRKDGSRVPVKVLQFPFRIDQDTLVDYTIYRDRSAEMKAEAAIRREKSFFEGLFDACPDAIILSNREGRILRANRAFYELFGYSFEDRIAGEDIYGIITKDPRSEAHARNLENRFWDGEQIDMDIVRQKKDGTEIHLHLTQVPFELEDGSVVDYIIYHDIGYRKKAEEKMRESERRYAAIVEDQAEMVCRFLPAGEVTFVNDAFCLFFGISRDQILSKPFSRILGSRDGESLGDGCGSLTPETHTIFIEHTCVLPSGKTRWLRWSKRGIFDEDGSLTEIQAVGRDITETKQTEKELRHLNSILRSIRGVNRLINRLHDSKRLIQEICAHLIETRGYRNVWIGILGKGGKLATISEAGIGSDGRPLSERSRHGVLNEWGLSVLNDPGVSVRRGVMTMTDCPLLDRYEEAGIMSTRLEYAGKVYGLISVSIPGEMPIDPEEESIFAELAEDISFALHAIEVENDREEKSCSLEGKALQLELMIQDRRDGLWEWDVEDGRVDLNPSYETMLGYTPGEMERSFKGWESYVHPEDLPEALGILKATISGQSGDLYEAVYRMRTREGKWRKILDRGYVVRRARHGRALRMVGTHTIIPDKEFEKRIHQ
ncbi:MAG: PAS domain S-box protein [Thermovirgaceae bacterium]|nr:PAS domain S-box protein [Thermovirgaceae bacterium]